MRQCSRSCSRSGRGEDPGIPYVVNGEVAGGTVPFHIPARLAVACRGVPEREDWLGQLPVRIRELQDRWSLSIEAPFENGDTSAAWVARATRPDGTRSVLKLGMPHMEGAQEIDGLRLWDGDPTVRLLEADPDMNAMLLEACEPGTSLREEPEARQDVIIAGLLRRIWRRPPPPHRLRPLSTMLAYWAEETEAVAHSWSDAGLVRAGLGLFSELSVAAPDDVLLATDLHAGNVLRAQREPWLVIDPKPFVGDRTYDATQHLFNCRQRVLEAPRATIDSFADRLAVDRERLRLWMFARAAAEPRDTWDKTSYMLARKL
jgi:streptomycin 6-kinase